MINTNKNIVIIGMPGCGKTTIGSMLAKKVNMNFIDIDIYIEEKEERSISELFSHGEEYFRKIESSVVEEVSNNISTVIATGGGVIKSYSNIKELNENGIIIFINRSVEDIVSDIDISSRPLLKDKKEKIYTLFEERYALYKKYCDYEIINDVKLDEVVDRIIECINIKAK